MCFEETDSESGVVAVYVICTVESNIGNNIIINRVRDCFRCGVSLVASRRRATVQPAWFIGIKGCTRRRLLLLLLLSVVRLSQSHSVLVAGRRHSWLSLRHVAHLRRRRIIGINTVAAITTSDSSNISSNSCIRNSTPGSVDVIVLFVVSSFAGVFRVLRAL